MLSILKNSLVTGVSQEDVMIRKRELDWLSRNYWILATQATLIAGFSFKQLTSPLPENIFWLAKTIYVLLLICTLVVSLYVVLKASFASILAPGLALRGSSGFASINAAIEYLRKHQDEMLWCFVLGLTTFMLSSFLIIAMIGVHADAVFRAELALLAAALVMLVAAWRITVKFKHDGYSQSGISALENTYRLIGDLDEYTASSPLLQ